MKYALPFLLCLSLCLGVAGPLSAQDYEATLEGSQEVPPVVTAASGSATFTLDAAKMLHFSITYANLSSNEIGAHIHGPAAPGVNAGVQFPLPAGNPKNGSVGPLSAGQEADLNAGLYYVNIHTLNNGGGEIRGQIIQTAVPVEPTTWGRVKRLFDR